MRSDRARRLPPAQIHGASRPHVLHTPPELARRGCHLALADVNEAGLAETAELAAGAGRRITCHRLDVADKAAIAAFPDIVTATHPGVDILVNNAGVAIGGTFDQVAEA